MKKWTKLLASIPILAALTFVLLVSVVVFRPDCSPEKISMQLHAYQVLRGVWQAANHSAGLVGDPSDLAGPVGVLQRIRLETWKVEGPACLNPARVELLKAMDATINGYLETMAGKDPAAYFREAGMHNRLADEAFTALITGRRR